MPTIIEKSQQLKALVIKNLYHKKELSLTELSKLTQKSLPVVTAIVNTLVNENYVLEQGLAPSTGGRRPSIFLLDKNKQKFTVAVAMDQFETRMAIFNLAGEIVVPITVVPLQIYQPTAVEALIAHVNQYLNQSPVDKANILGIGIGMPGFVNSVEGVNTTYLKVKNGYNLKQYLIQQFQLPVFIDNDSSLIALAELNFGMLQAKKDVMVVNIGWGTGLGIIINGKLYRGSTGYAGEFSHISLSNNTNLCICGKKGCLELETSILVMVEKVEKALREGATSSLTKKFKDTTKHRADHFLEAVLAHDPLALRISSAAAFQLGKGLSTLIHILNPESIILSGKGGRVAKVLLPAIQQAINEFCIPVIAQQTTIEASSLSENAELLAAASLVVANSKFT